MTTRQEEVEPSYRLQRCTICSENTVVLLVLLLSTGVIVFGVNPSLATGVGTLALAGITAVTVLLNREQVDVIREEADELRKQREKMEEELRLKRTPHVSFDTDDGLLLPQNIGIVNVILTARFAIAEVEETSHEHPLLKEDTSYEELPESLKVRIYRNREMRDLRRFLEKSGSPADEKRIRGADMLWDHLESRKARWENIPFWLRIDCTLEPDDGEKEYSQSFLYKVAIDSNREFSTFARYDFIEAQDWLRYK